MQGRRAAAQRCGSHVSNLGERGRRVVRPPAGAYSGTGTPPPPAGAALRQQAQLARQLEETLARLPGASAILPGRDEVRAGWACCLRELHALHWAASPSRPHGA